MKMRSILASTLALGASVAVATQAEAGFIVAGFSSTELIPSTGPTDRANTSVSGNSVYRVQTFNTSDAVSIDTVSILADSPAGNDVTLWITDGLGGGDNILYTGTFGTSTDAGGVASWHNFELSGADLGPAGQYFLVIGSSGTDGFKIRRTSQEGSIQLGDRGVSVIDQSDPIMGADYVFFSDGDVLAVQLTGSLIPAPGAIALAGLSGIVLVGRRRR